MMSEHAFPVADDVLPASDEVRKDLGTFVFADLAGFTALTEAHGDERATEIAEHFAQRVRALLPESNGEEIKTIGDEVMVRVEDPVMAVKLGLRIVEELAVSGSPPVRVGMHYGPAISRSGDWYGATVNLASRVAGAARPGEVLLTEDTQRRCGDHPEFELEARGSRYFKHIPEPVPVYRALGPAETGRELEIDPVCRMAVDPRKAAGVSHRRGVAYFFCSSKCARAFAVNPRHYVAKSPAARAARAGFRIHRTAFLIVSAALVLFWATGLSHHDSWPPWFLYFILPWAVVLALHYRATRRVL